MPVEVKERIDCIIVGAGPGGITTAGMLAARGLVVYLIDYRPLERIGHPWTNGVEARLFPELRIPKPKPPTLRPEAEVWEMVSPDGKSVIEIKEVPVLSINMREFTQQLLKGAIETGVRFLPEVRVKCPTIHNGAVGGLMVMAEGEDAATELRARMVIDASGIAGAVRHELPEDFGVQIQIDPQDVCHACQESREIDHAKVMELIAANRIRPNVQVNRTGFLGGYSVLSVYVNMQDDRVELLCGIKQKKGLPDAREVLDDYIGKHDWIGEQIMGGQGLIPIRRALENMVAPGFACVGDAACQTVPQHGSGVASAIRAGAMLGDVTAKALKGGKPTLDALWPYNVQWQRTRGAVLANSELSRLFSESLSRDELNLLFEKRIINPDVVRDSLEVLPLSIPTGTALLQGLKLLGHGALLGRFIALARRSLQVLKLYQSYPEKYDDEEYIKWQMQLEKIFQPLKLAAKQDEPEE